MDEQARREAEATIKAQNAARRHSVFKPGTPEFEEAYPRDAAFVIRTKEDQTIAIYADGRVTGIDDVIIINRIDPALRRAREEGRLAAIEQIQTDSDGVPVTGEPRG